MTFLFIAFLKKNMKKSFGVAIQARVGVCSLPKDASLPQLGE